jgi:hypothetical protein
MAIQTHFDQFDERIYLDRLSPAYEKAKKKDINIRDEIKVAFQAQGYRVIETFRQGSLADNILTAIKNIDGDYDIDRAIVISAENAPGDPVKPKQIMLDVLENKLNFKNPLIKMPCVTADYSGINLHIDFTVYTKDRYGDYKLAVGKLGSSSDIKDWSPADPRGLLEWIGAKGRYGENAIAKRKQFQRLVRYFKRWRDVNFREEVKKKIFSIGLTVMVKNTYQPNTESKAVDNDLVALKKVVDRILKGNYLCLASSTPDQYRVFVGLPCHGNRDIFNHKTRFGGSESGSDLNVGTQLKNKLVTLQEALHKASNSDDELEQCLILNTVFGSDFKKTSTSLGKKSAAAAASLTSAGAAGTSQGASAE